MKQPRHHRAEGLFLLLQVLGFQHERIVTLRDTQSVEVRADLAQLLTCHVHQPSVAAVSQPVVGALRASYGHPRSSLPSFTLCTLAVLANGTCCSGCRTQLAYDQCSMLAGVCSAAGHSPQDRCCWKWWHCPGVNVSPLGCKRGEEDAEASLQLSTVEQL